jgi:DNA segregation ATPase FtsK/SpoIIIE-like protein
MTYEKHLEDILDRLQAIDDRIEALAEAIENYRDRGDMQFGALQTLLAALKASGHKLPFSVDGLSDGPTEDEMYPAAREAVIEVGKASTSYLQRKLGCGYSRAAKLIDMLEENGVIGPADGAKPRQVLLQS